MGSIIGDIVDEISVKPNKSKLYIKWIISIAGSLIALAFVFGQFKASFFDRMDGFETSIMKNTAAVGNLEINMDKRFNVVDAKIDKVYSDGLTIFNDFQEYNDKQLELIIDYGNGNKDMLKRMLEISSMKQQQEVKNQIETAKREEPQPVIGVTPMNNKPYMGEIQMIEVETGDTIFHISGATKKYIDSIDRNKYKMGATTESPRYPNRYDVAYRNK